MKSNFRKASLLLTGILVGGKLFAQTGDTTKATVNYVQPFAGNSAYRTWSIGVTGGALSTYSIFSTNRKQDFTSPGTEFGYGGYVKYQVTPTVGFQADFLAGKLSGNDGQPNAATGLSTLSGFSTKIHYSGSISTNITVGNISWKDNKSAIQPYFTAGIGSMNYTPVLTYTDGTVSNFKQTGSGAINELYMPVGVGLKFDLAPGVNLDLGYKVNFVYADNVDGYNYGSFNDRFSYAYAGLEFSLGKRSKPQLSTHNPVSSMRQEYMMQNAATKSMLEGELAAQKAQNDQLRSDLNTTNANLAKLTMDSDGDGVPDPYDKCPNTPKGTAVDGSGCPLPTPPPAETKVYITEADRAVVKEAIKNLEFDFGKATIREHSLPSLDKVAQLLMDKKFHLKLAGYTDNVGGVAANRKLSKDRAQSIKDYLISKGADESLITAEGYGKSNPIATNKTAAGRQINRRVEFSLY